MLTPATRRSCVSGQGLQELQTVDACKEVPSAPASSVAKRAAARALASAWETARCRAAIRRALPSGLHPEYSAASSGLAARLFTVGHAS